jgi:hypothetical protein
MKVKSMFNNVKFTLYDTFNKTISNQSLFNKMNMTSYSNNNLIDKQLLVMIFIKKTN